MDINTSEIHQHYFAKMLKIIQPNTDLILTNIPLKDADGNFYQKDAVTNFYFRIGTLATAELNWILVTKAGYIDGKIHLGTEVLDNLKAGQLYIKTFLVVNDENFTSDFSYDSQRQDALQYYLAEKSNVEEEPDLGEQITQKVLDLENKQVQTEGRLDNLDASVNSIEATASSTLEKVDELDQNITNIDANVNDILAALPNHLIVHSEDWSDCNTWRTNGFVRTNTETLNCPEGPGHYGMLLWVSKSDDDVTGIQVFTDYSGGGETCKTFIRRYSRTNDEWGGWYRFANNLDIENLQESIASTAAGAQQSLSDAANQLWTVYHELNGRTDTLSDAVTDLQHQIDNLPTGEGGGSGSADTSELEKTLAQILSAYHAEMEDNELASAKAIANLADQLGGLNQILESI